MHLPYYTFNVYTHNTWFSIIYEGSNFTHAFVLLLHLLMHTSHNMISSCKSLPNNSSNQAYISYTFILSSNTICITTNFLVNLVLNKRKKETDRDIYFLFKQQVLQDLLFKFYNLHWDMLIQIYLSQNTSPCQPQWNTIYHLI